MPGHLIEVDELPKGSSGKVQRQVLKTWFAEGRGRPLR